MLETLGSLFRYFWAKVLLTIPFSYFVFTEDEFLIVYALILILILDTILGIWVAIKYKVFASHRLGRITAKLARYGIGLASVWVLASVAPSIFGWSFQLFGTFFILTEVFSNFEKLSLLGMPLPTKLLAKLNKNFYNFYNSSEEIEKKEAISKILSKNNERYSIYPNDIQ